MSSLKNTPQSTDPVKLITEGLFDELRNRAREAPRRRVNFNFHPDLADNPHRFLNVMSRGTYITPHRHLKPPKAESFLVLRGTCAFFIFDDQGEIEAVHRLGEGGEVGIDIAPGIWHTLCVLTDHAVCFEVKPGPYIPSDDKEFAPWAPAEGEPGCDAYLERILKRVPSA